MQTRIIAIVVVITSFALFLFLFEAFPVNSGGSSNSSNGIDSLGVSNNGNSSNNIIRTFESSTSSSKRSSSIKKLVHSSIRLEEDVFKLLQSEADRQGISVNSLINKTLKNYVTSEMYFERLGFLLVSKDFLRKTFTELTDEKRIVEYGRELGLMAAKEYLSYFFPAVNPNTIIYFLDIWFKRFQSYQHRFEDVAAVASESSTISTKNKREQQQKPQRQCHIFTVIHDINYNFSISLKAMLEGLVEPMIKSPISFRELTPNSISFSFDIINNNIK
jgi:predicted HicB family RNase H-like nuclease